jgi:hypothetical protein
MGYQKNIGNTVHIVQIKSVIKIIIQEGYCKNMNELALYIKNLPYTLEDLSRFVFFGREKYNAVRAEIRAMEKLKLVDEIRNQKRQEAQMLAETILDVEVRLGELFKEIPKAVNQYKSAAVSSVDSKTKRETLEKLGFSKKQGERLEILAENADLVEQVKAEARENNDFPTRAQVLERAKFRIIRTDANIDEYESDENNAEEIRLANYEEFLNLSVKVFKELTKIIELIANFEITPHRMDALIDNFDSVLKPDNEIRYINDSIDKLNKIKSELWKANRYETRKQTWQ